MAKIIVIEGPDKVGKETQSKMLVAHLRSMGRRATRVEVPFNDNFSHKVIYWMLKNGHARTYPTLFQWVQYMNKKIFEYHWLPRLERDNEFVVLDRWSLSALVYGVATGVSRSSCERQFRALRRPSATIVMSGRAMSDKKDDAYETDTYIQRRVRYLYGEWAIENPVGTRVIASANNRGEVHSNIVAALREMNVL